MQAEPLRLACLQHVPFEGPAAIADWARQRGHRLERIHVYRGDPLPETRDYDLLLVMGGPMGATDTLRCPWLAPEQRAIAAALRAGRGIVGICLGAQLLAATLGARVYPAAVREIGWLPVERVGAGGGSLLDPTPQRFVPLHWHADTFDLPAGARHLAATEAVPHQAFQYGERALGLQFHLESTLESVASLVESCAADLAPGPHVQAAAEILRAGPRIATVRPILTALLDRLETLLRDPER